MMGGQPRAAGMARRYGRMLQTRLEGCGRAAWQSRLWETGAGTLRGSRGYGRRERVWPDVWPSNGGQGQTVRHTGGHCGKNGHEHRGTRVHEHGDEYGNGRPVGRARGYARPPESGGGRGETYKDPTRTKAKESCRVVNKSKLSGGKQNL